MKYLSVDFGFRRIGLAISEGELASPWKIVEVRDSMDALKKIFRIAKEEKFDKVIIGLPEGQIGKATVRFIKRLKAKGIEVESADETLSSKQALKEVIEMGVGQEKRKQNDDIAAAIILQNYLDDFKK